MQVHSPIHCGLFRIRREEGEEAAEKQQNSIYNDSWWNYGKLLRHSQIVLGDIHVPSMYECLYPFHPFIMKKHELKLKKRGCYSYMMMLLVHQFHSTSIWCPAVCKFVWWFLPIFFLWNSKLAFINRAPNMKLVVSQPNSRTQLNLFLEFFKTFS